MQESNTLKAIKQNVMKIRTRKYVSTIFCLDEKTKSEYVQVMSLQRNIKPKTSSSSSDSTTSSESSKIPFVCTSSVVESSSSARDIPCIETLKRHFTETKCNVEKDRCYYIVYDIGFFNSANAYRTLICLISYIPEELRDVTDKFVYSRNSLILKEQLEIGKHITINNWKNLTYEYLVDTCMEFKSF